MEIPKFNETFAPILITLKKHGLLSRSDLKQTVIDEHYFNLTQEQRDERTSDGQMLISNRIGYGLMYLKAAKLIEQPQRAIFKITEKGLIFLENNKLSVKEIRNDIDFITHNSEVGDSKTTNDEVVSTISESASPQDLIDSGISQVEIETKTALIQRLREINPFFFERIVADLFRAMNYGDVQVTKKSGDNGIDGIINLDKLGLEKVYIQAKRYAEDNTIGSPEINGFVGSIKNGVKMGIFVTTSSFTKAAKEAIVDTGKIIKLIDGKELADLMYQYGVGVQEKSKYIIKILDEDFFEEN